MRDWSENCQTKWMKLCYLSIPTCHMYDGLLWNRHAVSRMQQIRATSLTHAKVCYIHYSLFIIILADPVNLGDTNQTGPLEPLFLRHLLTQYFLFDFKLIMPCLLRHMSAIAHHHTPKMVLSAIFSTPKSGKTYIIRYKVHTYSKPNSRHF